MRPQFIRVLLAAALGSLTPFWLDAPMRAQVPTPECGTEMRVLVISADGNEAGFPAILQALDYVGIPYDLYLASQNPAGLTAAQLADGCRALNQGVILATNLALTSAADIETLNAFQAAFGVRQVTWYTWPTPTEGFNWATDASETSTALSVTAAGAQVFSYLNASASGSPVPVQLAWTYHATPLDANTTPLLTDPEGHALVAVRNYPDGRANLAMTFDSNPYLMHTILLSYGVVNWVTQGLFVGARHVYMSPQIDDVFLDNSQWLTTTACGTNVDQTGSDRRMTGADLDAVFTWQSARRQQPATTNLRLTMAYNGGGTTGIYSPDTLTPAAVQHRLAFFWVNHTWDHEGFDEMSYADAVAEITRNATLAEQLGFPTSLYSPMNLVQPNVSGLENANVLTAARDSGVRYVVSDTSRAGWNNPSPNIGSWSTVQPEIFIIPRRPNNLFFNVAEPASWVTEYNCIYAAFWGRDLTYDEILEVESHNLLTYMLRGELDPWMFHQLNIVAYDGGRTLLTDLLDRTLTKYDAYFVLPVVSPSMDELGARMANRTAWKSNGITATILAGRELRLMSAVDVTVPITGLETSGSESYGGQPIAWITLRANEPQTIPLQPISASIPPPTAGPARLQKGAPALCDLC